MKMHNEQLGVMLKLDFPDEICNTNETATFSKEMENGQIERVQIGNHFDGVRFPILTPFFKKIQ